jgi:guanylate kinase
MKYPKLHREGMIICLAGPSAGGKTSLGTTLLQKYSDTLRVSISATTRSPRSGEIDGKHYHFIDHDTFQAKVANGEFFEWAKVHGQLYGTLKESIESTLKQGLDLLLDIDIQGVRSIKASYPHSTVTVFIVPPDVTELKRRIALRSKTSEEEIHRRLETAKVECSGLMELIQLNMIDYFLVNDDRATSENLVCSIYNSERIKVSRLSKDEIRKICVFD